MTTDGTSLCVERTIDAPRERVWRTWTEPLGLSRWWWPERFRTTYEIDLHEGGAFRFRTEELKDIGVLSLAGKFFEIEPPERLAYTWNWEAGEEPQTSVRVEFRDRGDRTDVRVIHEGFETSDERDNHVQGWNDCLDRLQRCELLASD